MRFEPPVARGPVRDLVDQIGGLSAFSTTACARAVTDIVRGRLPVAETVNQALFVARVCTVPALLLMLPIGVLIAVSVGSLAGRLGAGAYSGAVVAFVVVGQAAALVCALMLAGVAGSAICADLGSRTIREEIAAMEVMGVDVVDQDRERGGDHAVGQGRNHSMFRSLAVQPDNTVTGVNLSVDCSVTVVFDRSRSQPQHVDEVGVGRCDVAVDQQRGPTGHRRLFGRQARE